MVHRGIASLALVMMVCFLLLSHFDPQFFWVHLYESLIYIVMVVMLLYGKHRWPYMLGRSAIDHVARPDQVVPAVVRVTLCFSPRNRQ